jgi:hypothetical protein
MVARMTINMLPDIALLEIFDFYVDDAWMGTWHRLVHVCRKWRSIVFGSPRRLGLRLRCIASTPVRETLDVWPLLPIVVWDGGHERWGVDSIIAALERNDRICQLVLNISNSHMEKVLAVMQRPFPAMTSLSLEPQLPNETVPVIPAPFLGGSAPRLQHLTLSCIPFPGLPKLLLFATHLVYLRLWRIPDSGYISPEAMVTCLSVLIRLESLSIKFKSPRCRPNRKSRRPPTRIVLPVLTTLEFRGVGEYLEDLVARVDAPQLDDLTITFFHQLIFDTPQINQFISRTPRFKTCDEVQVVFFDTGIFFLAELPQTVDRKLELGISCQQPDWQLSSLAQVCSSSLSQTLIFAVERLYILESRFPQLDWQDDIENSQWLELFHPFTAVKDLYISSKFALRITPALQELVWERAIEVLPALQNIFLEEPLPSGPAIGQFVAARQLAGHPIAVSRWEREKGIDVSEKEIDD